MLKKLLIALASMMLLASLSTAMTGCCNCNDEEASKKLEEELDKEFEKIEKDAKKKDKKSKKDDDGEETSSKKKKDEPKDDEEKPSKADGPSSVKSMTPDKIEARMKDLGWTVIGEPTRINDKSVTLPVTKGTTGGAVSLNEFDVDIATNAFVDTMLKNDGAALARSGNKVVSVIMPGKKSEAEKILKQLVTDAPAAAAGGDDEEEDGGDSAGGDAAVAKMTPSKIEAKVKKLGWKTVGEPTRLNDQSVTLPVVKGTTGGAVSLNEFDNSIATNAFYDTMAKNKDAALARSGDKVVSVIMPGKKAEAEKLLKKILED